MNFAAPNELISIALQEGATAARFFPPRKLVVEDQYANFCEKPRCPNYGLSFSCPPYVEGPQAFRKWRDDADHALALKIDIPAEILKSTQRLEVMRVLHEVVAVVETCAQRLGYPRAMGFAGGSCKQLFCGDEVGCRQISAAGKCRYPDRARPSMSGFGVNVAAMMELSGWDNRPLLESDSESEQMSWVAGLVLLLK